MKRTLARAGLAAFLAVSTLLSQSRPVPPPGVAVPDADRAELETGLTQLGKEVEKLRGVALVSDVEIYHKAVHYALHYGEFFKPEEIGRAKAMLRQGMERASQLSRGSAPWTHATGLVVRGYYSKIDGSVQPYGLVVPPRFDPTRPLKWRLDTWFHGRGETLSELNFIADRQTNPGEFTPENAFVVHLYGRYCNANKLAGEVDLFETLDAVKKAYPIDENRIVIRGFSMGGAATWHFAAHYPGDWAAAAPGAGFSETPDFLKVFANETLTPTPWEKKLWHQYDATDYAINFAGLPTVAYSGEKDNQIQAARVMETALASEGMKLTHIIGPDTGHRYHPAAREEVNRRIDAIAARGRDPYPRRLRFTTWTLAYNRMKWLTLDSMEEHWARALVDASVVGESRIQVSTKNVAGFTLNFAPGNAPLDPSAKPEIAIDGQKVEAAAPESDRSWTVSFHKSGGKWAAGAAATQGLAKRHGLQGPVDDAFLNRFIMVRPTGKPAAPSTAAWVKSEMDHAVTEWRKQFRGDAMVKNDSEITDADIASSNLVVWGDPGSNAILARIAAKLPVQWSASGIVAGSRKFPAEGHVPVLIYPNPLNPAKYVVLNSGFTFREYDYLNNARQVPKLPDYAIVDLSTPPNDRYPGNIVHAGFFGERWEWKE